MTPELHGNFNNFPTNLARHIALNTSKARHLRQESTSSHCIGTPPTFTTIPQPGLPHLDAGLSDRILWDVDYESGPIFMDHSPEMTQWLKSMARIPDNYYTSIADDLTDEEAAATIKELKKLCDSIIEPS